MLAFERVVVDALTSVPDPLVRAGVAQWVEDSLADMPEHLRLGVAAESVALGALARLTRAEPERLVERLAASPLPLVPQWVRLLRSLVLFAEHELDPAYRLDPAEEAARAHPGLPA